MASKIKLVQGDNLPNIRLALTNYDDTPLDVSAAIVKVYFRAAGTDVVLATLICTNITDGTDGLVYFNFPDQTLDVDPGAYEGEVEVHWGTENQTVYDILKFVVREQFA